MNFNIFNQNEEQVAIFSLDKHGNHTPIFSAQIDEKLDSYDILTITVPADSTDTAHLIEGNTIVFKDVKGWREYEITEVEDIDEDALEKTIVAELSAIELTDDVINTEYSSATSSPSIALGLILEDTRWTVGYVDPALYDKPLKLETKYMNVLEAISELAKEYKGEVQFSYEVADGQITARKVNLYKTFGKNEGKRFEIGKDILSIKRTIDITQLKTAIIPYTAPFKADEEDSESDDIVLDITDVEWSIANGDPVDKPKGQNYIGDPVALQNFGRKGKDGLRHRFLSMEMEVESTATLMSMAWMQLGRYATPKVTYEVKAIDLYIANNKSDNFKHEQVFLGDTVIAIDKKMATPIKIETRVVEVSRDLLDPLNNDYVFGNSKEIFSYKDEIKELEDKIDNQLNNIKVDFETIQTQANGMSTIYRGSNVPVKPKDKDLWYRPHPTVIGERQMLIFNGVDWELVSDTSITDKHGNELIQVKKETAEAIKKAQDAMAKIDSVENSLQFKVDSEDYNSAMSLLHDNLNLRVEKGDIIHQINISDEEILIAGDRIIISGDTTVDGSFKVTDQMIASGISADKVNFGTLDGAQVNVINLNADNISGGSLDIKDIKLKNGNKTILSVNQQGEVELNVTKFTIKAQDLESFMEDTQNKVDISIADNTIEYYLSDSPIILAGGQWYDEAPLWVSDKYMWQRTKVTLNNGTVNYAPSENGTCIAGAKGQDAIVAVLTNESHIIPTDENGSRGNYIGANTEIKILEGATDTTSTFAIEAKASIGVMGSLSGNKYTVTEMADDTDTGKVTLTAKKGSTIISKIFTITKSKQGFRGQDSQDPLIYKLETDSLVLLRGTDGTINPRSINIQAISMKGNDPQKPFAGYFRVYEQHASSFKADDFTKLTLEGGITEEEYIISLCDEPRIIRYESYFKESSLKYEPRADAISVYIQLFKDSSFKEVLDSQTLVIVSDGKEGAQGAKGEDAYRVEVLSRNGNTFKNGVVDTWLYAVVYKGEDDITDELEIDRFRWERVSSDPASDTLWNQRYFGGTKEIRITTDDVCKRATFTCSITKQ